ncbi:hypothetical protein [Candidatus Reidiella endopervernicosa]|uniref:Calx-beta domain-containing protein n=1 Tax=Candidatus Reidiella endopervernicosa TaxID=2738883 RepID=A0A6N0HST3_9GAMM|nr:hypothetical protein [Candidatus Reidiella endopervernicosa]QKQ25468.1 hypothetical protein HUE57_03520 [Candidatus Reidiella endopervernicosa]
MFSAPGNSAKFIFRIPDGTGDWDHETSAAEDPTEDASNEGDTVPALSFEDQSVAPGDTVTITFTLDAPATAQIDLEFYTIDGTATSAGGDYTEVGTQIAPFEVSIGVGESEVTVEIPTGAGATIGDYFDFFVNVSDTSAGGATITDHVGTVTFTEASGPDHYAISHAGVGVTCDGDGTRCVPCGSGTGGRNRNHPDHLATGR